MVDLIGRVEMNPNFDNPFTKMDQLLRAGGADLTLVDFHLCFVPYGKGLVDIPEPGPEETEPVESDPVETAPVETDPVRPSTP